MPEPTEMLDNLLMNQTLYEGWIVVLTIQAQAFQFLPSMFSIVIFSFKYITVYLQEKKKNVLVYIYTDSLLRQTINHFHGD